MKNVEKLITAVRSICISLALTVQLIGLIIDPEASLGDWASFAKDVVSLV